MLEKKIMSTELENYLNRNKMEKVPSSRVDIIELGKWFAERVFELQNHCLVEKTITYKEYYEKYSTNKPSR